VSNLTSTASLPLIRPVPGSAPRANAESVVTGEHWRISVLTDGLFRLEWSDDGRFEDRASSFVIRRDLPVPPFSVDRVGDGVTITTARAQLRYDGRPFSAQGLVVDLLGEDAAGSWRFGHTRGDLGGTARTLDDVDGRTDLGGGVLAADGVTSIDDSESFLFDDDGWVSSRLPGRSDIYVFAFGRDFSDALAAFHAIAGAPTRLPRWALGNWWSRYHPYSDASYLELMDRFDEEGLPFSVAVIDMDWHRVDSVPARFGSGWTGYSWEPELFPRPAEFLETLRRRGMRVTLNLHPADGVRAFEDAYPAVAEAVGVDPGSEVAIPFAPTNPAFLRSYFEHLHHPIEDQGVDFWWIDWQQGDTSDIPGVDPLWMLNHFHHLDAARNGGPGLTFSRYAGPGSHRYGVGFSGDTVVSWASLAFQPEFTARAANIGYGWWSHDIGGHTRGISDDELATRWVQSGVFSPIMRLHSANNPFIRKEPWMFSADHHQAMNSALRLRHRLVPYLHTMNHLAEHGQALVRPMYHLEPRRSEAFHVPNEYAFGTELIVAPITEPADAGSRHGRVTAWLPPGVWTDVTTGSVYRGDRTVELHRDVQSIPVLLRAGGILPLTATDDLDATRNPERLEILVAPAASGTFTMIEDGIDETADDATARTTFSWNRDAGELRIGSVQGDRGLVPPTRSWTLTFLGRLPAGAEITLAGRTLAPTVSDDRFSVTVDAAAADESLLTIAGGTPVVGSDPRPRIRRVLERAQMSNPEKLAAWEVVDAPGSAAERIASLAAVGLPPAVLAAVTELLGTLGADAE